MCDDVGSVDRDGAARGRTRRDGGTAGAVRSRDVRGTAPSDTIRIRPGPARPGRAATGAMRIRMTPWMTSKDDRDPSRLGNRLPIRVRAGFPAAARRRPGARAAASRDRPRRARREIREKSPRRSGNGHRHRAPAPRGARPRRRAGRPGVRYGRYTVTVDTAPGRRTP